MTSNQAHIPTNLSNRFPFFLMTLVNPSKVVMPFDNIR